MKKTKIFFLALLCLFGNDDLYAKEVAHLNPHLKVPPGPEAMLPGYAGEPAPVVIMGEVMYRGEKPETYIGFDMDYMAKSDVGPHLIHEKMEYIKPTFHHGADLHYSSIFQWVSPPIGRSAYLTISQNHYPLLDRILVMPGDTVQIKFDLMRGMQMYYGPAAQSFKCQYELKWAKENRNYGVDPVLILDNIESYLGDSLSGAQYKSSRAWPGRKLYLLEGRDQELNLIENMFSASNTDRYEILEKYKDKIPFQTYQMLKVQLWTEKFGALYRMGLAYKIAMNQNDEITFQKLNKLFIKYLPDPIPQEFDEHYLSESAAFMDYIRSWSQAKKLGHQMSMFEVLQEIPSKVIRDRAIGGYFLTSHKNIIGLDSELSQALDLVDDENVKSFIRELLSDRGKGTKMPDFSFSDPDGNQRRLSEFEDKVVLLDFWFTGCKPCVWFYTEVLQEVEEHYRDEEGFKIISISVDSKKDLWLKSIQSGNYTSPAVINLYTNGKGTKHPYLSENNISGFPNHILLAKGGKLFVSGKIPKEPKSLIQLIDSALDK